MEGGQIPVQVGIGIVGGVVEVALGHPGHDGGDGAVRGDLVVELFERAAGADLVGDHLAHDVQRQGYALGQRDHSVEVQFGRK
ncbi:hypothetical protein ACFSTC_27060 [Nonomuraea ferruginea]